MFAGLLLLFQLLEKIYIYLPNDGVKRTVVWRQNLYFAPNKKSH